MKIIKVAAAVISENGKILITRRNRDEDMGGFWEFPGGKIEGGETVPECIEREIKEELSLSINTGRIISESVFSCPGFDIHLTAVSAFIRSGKIKLTVHDMYEWIYPENFTSYNFAPADIPVCRKIAETPEILNNTV